jgi:hypothetical protein
MENINQIAFSAENVEKVNIYYSLNKQKTHLYFV